MRRDNPLNDEIPPRAGFREKRLIGFEPTTFCMASRRSSQLSYSRTGRAFYPRKREPWPPAARSCAIAVPRDGSDPRGRSRPSRRRTGGTGRTKPKPGLPDPSGSASAGKMKTKAARRDPDNRQRPDRRLPARSRGLPRTAPTKPAPTSRTILCTRWKSNRRSRSSNFHEPLKGPNAGRASLGARPGARGRPPGVGRVRSPAARTARLR